MYKSDRYEMAFSVDRALECAHETIPELRRAAGILEREVEKYRAALPPDAPSPEVRYFVEMIDPQGNVVRQPVLGRLVMIVGYDATYGTISQFP
jgi:hypothetical protein